ncbi:hypothetical protein GYN67_00835 [Lactococcus piscium]|uniref:DapH/DapD/GlmU-related protein n=1 Tax=Pseudolactococcus carnosus TaxID=2749961 RepID=UPI001FBB5DCB|nr:DapH/DapD/GlmU-related protein [Lactococcus carnosus]MCJ1995236.1 hypothetical protein [Lactococcus carnosus]
MENLIDINVSLIESKKGNSNWIRAETKIKNSIIGNNIFINFRCKIINSKINDHVQIASEVKIGGKNNMTQVGSSSWIGANSIICEGIKIGKNCVIGANSIINEHIPDNSIAYGRDKLIIKDRIFLNKGRPDFSEALKYKLMLHEKGEYFKEEEDGNYNSAMIFGDNYRIGNHNILIGNSDTQGYIDIGQNVEIGNKNIFEGSGKIFIGQGTKIGNNTHIISSSHNYHVSNLPMVLQPVKIGANVLIEDNCIILGNVIIPDNSIIEKGSFIRK